MSLFLNKKVNLKELKQISREVNVQTKTISKNEGG